MKAEHRTGSVSWQERLAAMNLILPMLEIAVFSEVILLIGLLAKSVLSLLPHQKSNG